MARLVATDGTAGDYFGNAVAVIQRAFYKDEICTHKQT
jgi:hypothetical protein